MGFYIAHSTRPPLSEVRYTGAPQGVLQKSGILGPLKGFYRSLVYWGPSRGFTEVRYTGAPQGVLHST